MKKTGGQKSRETVSLTDRKPAHVILLIVYAITCHPAPTDIPLLCHPNDVFPPTLQT
jgi:hypothetical protein